jgi:hypothetical protein
MSDGAAFFDFVVEIIRRSDDWKSFQVLPRRRIFAHAFGRMVRCRSRSRDDETRNDVSRT